MVFLSLSKAKFKPWRVKKCFAFILFLLYFFSFAGTTINIHYCQGRFVAWSLQSYDSEKKCPNCGMTTQKRGCCEDKQITIKTETHTPAFETINTTTFEFSLEPYFFQPIIFHDIRPLKNIYSPHRAKPISVYKVCCVFLIWYFVVPL